MKNIIRNLASAVLPTALVFGLAGCQEEENRPQIPEVNQNDIEFSATAGAVTSEGATITIKHNGTDNETYYGFWYTDLETNMASAINRTVASLMEEGTDISTVVTTGTTHVTVLTGLSPLTSYRYVVFGLNDDGTIYGTPASAEFTTLKGEVEFTVSVASITETTANATVTSTGDNTDTWYCFATTDLTSSLADVVSAEVSRLGSNVSSVVKSGNSMVQLTGLSAGTSYRAVVTGLTSDGNTYGTPVSANFRTSSQQVEYTVNPNWTVTYGGTGTYEGQAADFISVKSTDSQRYFTAVYPVSDYNKYGIQAIAEAKTSYYNESYGSTWVEYLTYTSSVDNEPWNLFTRGVTYYAMAIGVDESGNPTGLYALSEAFEPAEIQASDAYKQWLGSWTVSGSNGVTNTIVIEALAADQSYTVKGWQEGLMDDLGIGFPAEFDQQTQSLVFVATEETLATVNTGTYGLANVVFLGIVEGSKLGHPGDDVRITGAPYDIAIATMSTGGAVTVTAQDIPLTGGVTETFIGMEYFGNVSAGALSWAADYPRFPITMTKSSSAGSGRSVKCVKADAAEIGTAAFKTLSPLRMYNSAHAVKPLE